MFRQLQERGNKLWYVICPWDIVPYIPVYNPKYPVNYLNTKNPGKITVKKLVKLAEFLLIAFLLPLIGLFSQTFTSDTTVNFILFGIQAASPTIAAIVVLLFSGELIPHLGRTFRRGYSISALIVPFLFVTITMLVSKLIYCGISGNAFSAGDVSSQLFVIFWSLIAEEFGWRGFLEPMLKQFRINAFVVPGITGLVWSLWHYHYFLQNRMEIPILLFALGCIIESYLYSYFVRAMNSVLAAMSLHFSWNLMIHVFLLNPSDNNGSILPYAILIIIEAVELIAIVAVTVIGYVRCVNEYINSPKMHLRMQDIRLLLYLKGYFLNPRNETETEELGNLEDAFRSDDPEIRKRKIKQFNNGEFDTIPLAPPTTHQHGIKY